MIFYRDNIFNNTILYCHIIYKFLACYIIVIIILNFKYYLAMHIYDFYAIFMIFL